MAAERAGSYPPQAIEITIYKFLTACFGASIGPANTHLCFSNENHSVGRGGNQALATRKYDYSIQSCYLMCFNTQSVLQHPEILYHSYERMRSICICCHYIRDILYLPWLIWALRLPAKVQTKTLTTNITSKPPPMLIAMWLASLLVPKSLSTMCLSTLEAGLLQ